MNSKLALAMAALGVICAGNALAAKSSGAYGDDDPMPFVRAGEFMLQDGQREGIANDSKAEPYRVCVGKARKSLVEGTAGEERPERSVGLTVMYDGKSASVAAGSCSDFTAKQITVMPAGALAEDEVLMGRYKHLW
jgi:hypothetical protein